MGCLLTFLVCGLFDVDGNRETERSDEGMDQLHLRRVHLYSSSTVTLLADGESGSLDSSAVIMRDDWLMGRRPRGGTRRAGL